MSSRILIHQRPQMVECEVSLESSDMLLPVGSTVVINIVDLRLKMRWFSGILRNIAQIYEICRMKIRFKYLRTLLCKICLIPPSLQNPPAENEPGVVVLACKSTPFQKDSFCRPLGF